MAEFVKYDHTFLEPARRTQAAASCIDWRERGCWAVVRGAWVVGSRVLPIRAPSVGVSEQQWALEVRWPATVPTMG